LEGFYQRGTFMKIRTKKWRHLCFVFALTFMGISDSAMAIEEPAYSIEVSRDNYEIRKYDPIIVAETQVIANFEDAGSQAFRILADFIFGNNTSRTKIDMTAPVTQAPSEKIEMTAPVTQTQVGSTYIVQFTMPAKYTLETLPKPNDSRVTIREIGPRRLAVYTYSGSWSEKNYERHLKEFKESLAYVGERTIGEPTLARYNSPFQLPFLRRNEIWFQLQ